MIARIIFLSLQQDGHDIRVALSGSEAIVAAQSVQRLDLLIVDHSMPPDRGRALAENVLLDHPAMKVMHVSGYPRNYLEEDGGFTPGAGFIQKPFTPQKIREVVSRILDVTEERLIQFSAALKVIRNDSVQDESVKSRERLSERFHRGAFLPPCNLDAQYAIRRRNIARNAVDNRFELVGRLAVALHNGFEFGGKNRFYFVACEHFSANLRSDRACCGEAIRRGHKAPPETLVNCA